MSIPQARGFEIWPLWLPTTRAPLLLLFVMSASLPIFRSGIALGVNPYQRQVQPRLPERMRSEGSS